MSNSSFFLDRGEVGMRYFTKADGKVYVTRATGVFDEKGQMTYADHLVSESAIDASAALTDNEYKLVDSVVTDVGRTDQGAVATFLGFKRFVPRCVQEFDGLKHKVYYYKARKSKTASRATMDLEDDAPTGSAEYKEYQIPLPLENSDWSSNIRREPTASFAAGYNVNAENAALTAEGVQTGLDLRFVNGWGSLTYRGGTVYGLRDLPTTRTVTQAGTTAINGWLDTTGTVTTATIYENIRSMVKTLNKNGVEGPYVLVLPDSFRFRMADPYKVLDNGEEISLYKKVLDRNNSGVPNILNIADIVFLTELNYTKTGGDPSYGEAYLFSISPKWFRVLNYLPMTNFTISLKGDISTKHRITRGACPLWRKDFDGNYGFVKLANPVSA